MALSAASLHTQMMDQIEAFLGTSWQVRLQGSDGGIDASGTVLRSTTLDLEQGGTHPGDRVTVDGQTLGIVGVSGHQIQLAAPVTADLIDQPFVVETEVAVDFSAGGAQETLQALADAVVAEVTGHATAAVSLDSVGVCTNTPMSPGAYTGVGTALSAGSVSGLSASRLASSIQSHLEDLLGPMDFAAGGGANAIEAIAEAVVGEITGHARVTASTTDTGTVPAGGGPVSGSGAGSGVLDALDADRLHADLKSRIQQKVSAADLTGPPDLVLQAVAVAVVDYLHAHAALSLSTDLSITAPPSGGPASGSGHQSGVAVS